jgi:hypothetical protein
MKHKYSKHPSWVKINSSMFEVKFSGPGSIPGTTRKKK